eukprot:CAMPEP_0197452734 /NCGR_PEP_ID=MMETSP1175-20131217/32831_1 /TAXON_ID=1003142 /ORGANISM="Triceratium dubium, Strain CCMP147" /LENGTH=56 /DNA_ID=CAMNT_0042985807 /DNA_START=27 /DNA_END=194 /DNA_ORIENTATION=-
MSEFEENGWDDEALCGDNHGVGNGIEVEALCQLQAGTDVFFLIFSAALVFFMQAGF